MKRTIRVGADVGGTFTDVALQVIDEKGAIETFTSKVLTDYAMPERAIVQGVEGAARSAGHALSDIDQVIHGITLVTNALIERRAGAGLADSCEHFVYHHPCMVCGFARHPNSDQNQACTWFRLFH